MSVLESDWRQMTKERASASARAGAEAPDSKAAGDVAEPVAAGASHRLRRTLERWR
jgi:hypothetical protein